MGKAATRKPKIAVRQQFGVLPYRETEKTGLEILLVTSRETRRWIIPKGWPVKGIKPGASAAQEAYEEAGLRGTTANRSLGSYAYEKRLPEKQATVPCEVKVYPMRVLRQEAAWPEQEQRETLWFSPTAAVAAVSEDGLKAIITDFAAAKRKSDFGKSKPKTKRKRSGDS